MRAAARAPASLPAPKENFQEPRRLTIQSGLPTKVRRLKPTVPLQPGGRHCQVNMLGNTAKEMLHRAPQRHWRWLPRGALLSIRPVC